MTMAADRGTSPFEVVLRVVASLASMILLGCASGVAPRQASVQPVTPFIKVAHTKNGYFFQCGTNLFYSLGVGVVIPEETWPDRPEFAKRKVLGSYDGLSRFGSDTQGWARVTAARLESWGFNTAAAWCSEELCQQP